MSIPQEILNDLSSRFLIHLPLEEKRDPTRLCFQVELAYWFYLDYYAGEGSTLPSVSMRDFTFALFNHIPALRRYVKRTDEIIATWKEYKFAVPTYGCIMVDEGLEHILLVQGYWSKSSWGFPKGKVNENEKPHRCAVREVLEETGFDCGTLIDKKEFLERRIGDHGQRLYVVPGISRETVFMPQTKKEIRSIRWFNINNLPTFKKDPTSMEKLGISCNSFFMVMPFVKPLRKWLNHYRAQRGISPLSALIVPKLSLTDGNSSLNGIGEQKLSSSRTPSVGHHSNTAKKSLTKLFEEQLAKEKQKENLLPKKYIAPLFEIPAWTNFKLNYDEYTKLVF